ncbi:HTTM domain-containing protein [Agromyces sp. NPDC058104]|uniref:HTTM domain-containing protein n=1 Tax=Agromyces sp. NPDC058104 TaxID=3346342 RepID=UPI0036D9F6F2
MRLTEIRSDPRPVAVTRIGLGIVAVLNAIEAFWILERIASGRLAVPVFADAPVVPLPWLIAGLIIGIAAGLAVTAGWMTAPAATVTALLGAATLLADQQAYSSHRWFATLLMVYLVFARSETAWSVRPRPDRGSIPWWPQLLMMSQLSVLYLFSAISKMNFTFISGAPLSLWVWIDLPWQAYFIAAVLTIAVELILAIGLWFRSSRRLAVILGLGLHFSIVVLMVGETAALIAFTITCVALYPLFLFRPSFRSAASGRPSVSGVRATAR